MIHDQVVDPTGPEAEVLLDDLRTLRKTARTQRHAFWFPLLMFGLLVCASAPLYVEIDDFGTPLPGSTGTDIGRVIPIHYPWLESLGGSFPSNNLDARGIYWLVVLLFGAVITGAWYFWHARVTGLRTRVGVGLATWIGGALLLVALSIASLQWIVSAWWVVTDRGTLALLVIALGLLVLAWVERSRLLSVIAVVYTGAACLGVFYDPINLLHRAGMSESALGSSNDAIVNVLLPGLVLIIGAATSFALDLRTK